MVMAKRNYMIDAGFGLHKKFTVGYLTVLDTGAGPDFVVKSVLPPQL